MVVFGEIDLQAKRGEIGNSLSLGDIVPTMHCKLFYLLFLLAPCVGSLLAQERFAPSGAEWCFNGYDGEGETIGYLHVRYERDSVVAGRATKVFSMLAKGFTPSGLEETFYSSKLLFQQSGDSIFYYDPLIRIQSFLFKESYEVGEETTTWMYNEPFEVSSVEEEIVDGVPISVAKMNLPEWLGRDLPATLYGYLGPDRGFTESWSYFLEGEGGLNLEAFRATDIPEIKVVSRSQCFALMDQVDDRVPTRVPIENCKIVPFPNPVASIDEWVRIKFDCDKLISGNFVLQIFNADGKEVMTPRRLGFIPSDFPVFDLPNGKYFGVITGEGERFDFSFTKNR